METRNGVPYSGTATKASRRRFAAPLLVALALLLLAGPAATLASGGTGYYGAHNHGTTTCFQGNVLRLTGVRAGSNRSSWGSADPGNSVAMQAYLYKWNGSSWVFQRGSGWKWAYPRYTTMATFAGMWIPTSGSLTNGYYRVATEFYYYDRATGQYMGHAANTWTAHYNYNAYGSTGWKSYCSLFGSARDAVDEAPKGKGDEPRLPSAERERPDAPTGKHRPDNTVKGGQRAARAEFEPRPNGKDHAGSQPDAPGQSGHGDRERDGKRHKH